MAQPGDDVQARVERRRRLRPVPPQLLLSAREAQAFVPRRMSVEELRDLDLRLQVDPAAPATPVPEEHAEGAGNRGSADAEGFTYWRPDIVDGIAAAHEHLQMLDGKEHGSYVLTNER